MANITRASGITAVWNVLSGNNLLKKHDLHKMDGEPAFACRVLGAVLGANLVAPLARMAMGIPSPSSEAFFLALGMAGLGFAVTTLPRNAYVACKAQKQKDMNEAAGAMPQPPQV